MADAGVEYIHLPANGLLPNIEVKPRRVMVLVEQDVDSDWQDDVSDWMVKSGARYMMAWGKECSSWDDSVDHANLREFDYSDMPEDRFVYTTWHENEALSEVFFFARCCASHPTVELPYLAIIDIVETSRETAILGLYEAEKAELIDEENPRHRPFLERLKILLKMK